MEPPEHRPPPLAASAEAIAARPRWGEALVRHLFVPGLLAMAGLLAVMPGAWGARELALWASIGAVLLAETLYPANPAWNYHLVSDWERGWGRLGRDAVYLCGAIWLTGPLITAVDPSVKAAIGWLGLERLHALWPRQAPLALRLVLAFFGVELCSYWLHRAAHRFAFLWQFHSTHHVTGELTGLKALRTHPVDNLLFHLARTAPLLLIGAGKEELVAVIYLGGQLSLLSHANLRVSERWLGWIVNFPRYHQVHHAASPTDSRANYGCHTILWDRLFRTFAPAARQTTELGMAPLGERTLWQELAWPFYRPVNQAAPGEIAPAAAALSHPGGGGS